MSDIVPFRGIRYNTTKVGDLSSVLAPPYDVISSAEQDSLYQLHPCNVVRVILGKEEPGDDREQNKYTRAHGFLQKWLHDQVLIRDQHPSLYVYQQRFNDQSNKTRERTGLIAAVRLQEFGEGGIRPHEFTKEAPKADRLNLLRAIRTNPDSIFALCDDRGASLTSFLKEATESVPIAEAADNADNVNHRLWRIDDPQTVRNLQEALRDQPLFIADGHHRYETALNYRKERQHAASRWTGDEPENSVMMNLVSINDPGLIILPTHRLIKFAEISELMPAVRELRKYFDVKELGRSSPRDYIAALEQKTQHTFVLHGSNTAVLLTLSDRSRIARWVSPKHSEDYNALDVTVLHSAILVGIFNDAGLHIGHIEYTADASDAFNRVNAGEFDAAFLLRPTRIEQVLAVASAGERMPPKSTYFYPKLVSGMVMRSLDD